MDGKTYQRNYLKHVLNTLRCGGRGNQMSMLQEKLKIALKAEAAAWEIYMATVAKGEGTLPAAGNAYKAALAAEEAAVEAAQALELF